MAGLSALALCACKLDTSVPEQAGGPVRVSDAALPVSPWRDAGGPIWRAPTRDASTPPSDSGARSDAGAVKDAGKHPRRDASAPHADPGPAADAASDAHTLPDPAKDAGRCGGCPVDKPHCLEDGTCAQCAAHDDCAQPGAPRCEPSTHTCVACLERDDCGSPTPACEPSSHTCVACIADGDCGDDNAVCDPASHTCVDCVDQGDCDDAGVCDTSAHRCVGCLQDGDCADAQHAHCEGGECEPCTDNSQCTHFPIEHTCAMDDNSEDGRCVECAKDADCTDLARPECDDDHCQACKSDDACEDRPNATVCDDAKRRRGRRGGERGTGACVECNADHDDACGDRVCDTEAKRCTDRERESARLCAPCLGDSECDGDGICASVAPADASAAAYCVIEDNAESCLESCALGLPLACALDL